MPLPYAAGGRQVKNNLGYIIPPLRLRPHEHNILTTPLINLGYKYCLGGNSFRRGDADFPRVLQGNFGLDQRMERAPRPNDRERTEHDQFADRYNSVYRSV